MRASLVTSAVLHALILGLGLFSLSAPPSFEVAAVDALPVDIVPIESITQIQQGDRTAALDERASPKPTERANIVPDATRIGENIVDTDAAPTPQPRPRPVDAAAVPPPSPRPEPRPADAPEPVEESAPAAVAATEVTPEPEPRQEVTPDPVGEAIAAADTIPDEFVLPDEVPLPPTRPEVQTAQTAKAPDRKETETPAKEAAATPKSDEKEFDADEVAALLNKERASGGGARRSSEQAALGGRKTTTGQKLTQSEMDALRGQVQRCWLIPAGAIDAENLRVSVKFKLDRSGALEGRPEIISGGGTSGVERAAAESARRAVSRCAPYTLPAEKYEAWADVIVNFDPREMF
jgi:colicin import membrane protein